MYKVRRMLRFSHPIAYTHITDDFLANKDKHLACLTSEKEIHNLIEQIEKEEANFFHRVVMIFSGESKFRKAVKLLDDHEIKLFDPYFDDEISLVIMKEEEVVNGYHLYDVSKNIMNRKIFRKICDLLASEKEWSKSEWTTAMQNTTCSAWNKMDEHGECYGGYWKYPKGTTERENAYFLSFEKNCKCMWKLPF